MNRERLTILRDHLAKLPDERVDMRHLLTGPNGENENDRDNAQAFLSRCGTAACIAGWTNAIWGESEWSTGAGSAADILDLSEDQLITLFEPEGFSEGVFTRADAVVAIQSMLDSDDDDALPVWPEKAEASS